MTRTVKLGTAGVIDREEFCFEIQQAKIVPWISELAPLLGDYGVQQTKILFEEDWSVTFKVNELEPGRAMFRMLGEHPLECELPQGLAEYFEAVLLRTYRDEMAQTHHIHIEGYLDGRHFDLTPLFDMVAPPPSAEEAEKIILGRR